MSYTSLSAKATGDTVSAADWALLDANLDDLDARISGIAFKGAHWTRTTALSIPDATTTPMQFGSAETYDEGGWGLTATNTTITVPAGAIPSGYTTIGVLIIASVEWANNATGRRILDIYKNGSVIQTAQITAGSNISLGMICPALTSLEAGDTITVQVLQDSGGALNANKGVLAISRFGPY